MPQQAAAGQGHPQGPGDVQRRQRGELIGALGLHRAGKRRDRPGDDVVVTGQHPGRRDRIEPERHEADRGDGDQRVSVQREMRRAPPDQDNPDHAGDGALEQDVVPAGRQGGDLVRGEPAVHHLRERAAKLTADRVDRDRVPQSGQRRARAEAGCVIEAPQQGRYRDDLQVAKGRVPDGGGVAGRDQAPGLHQRGDTRPRAAGRRRPARRGRAGLCCAGTGSCSGCAVCRKPHSPPPRRPLPGQECPGWRDARTCADTASPDYLSGGQSPHNLTLSPVSGTAPQPRSAARRALTLVIWAAEGPPAGCRRRCTGRRPGSGPRSAARRRVHPSG